MGTKKSNGTVDTILDLAMPLAKEQGVDIWDIRYEKEGSNWYLRIFLDKEEGIFIEDCEKFSRPFNKILDEIDPIKQEYVFEVCSPGLARELKRPEHFLKYINDEIKIRYIRPVDGVKEYTAVLKEYNKDKITVVVDGTEKEVNLAECAFIKLNDDADLFD